ncbi:MAG: DALR anticodon-binding domain-containing protein, partial [Chthonomonadales bacterium]
QLLLADGPDWKITDLISHSAAGYGDILVSDTGKLRADLLGLLRTRALVLFEEAGIRPDIIDAVLSNIPDENLEAQVALSRAQSLQSCSTRAEFTTVVQAAARVANILKSSKSGGAISDVSDALFADPSESALFESAVSIKQSVTIAAQSRQYDQVFVELATLSPEVDAFFLQVMVMAEDEAVRQNRLALLRLVDDLYRELADFTKIEG